jgi:hypothetical protein
MLESEAAPEVQVMLVTDFRTSPALDYVAGEKNAWTRQIALVKDADPLGPNFFVIHDRLDQADAAATWRFWLTAERVSVTGSGADVTGKEDVDTTIRFTQLPKGAVIRTEDLTRETWGLDENARYGRTSSTQTGLIASWESGDAITAVVYPRLREEQAPTITAIADGAGVKVESAAGIDYVFLSRDPLEVAVDGILMRGKVGAVQIRGDRPPRLFLGAAGELSCRGQTISRE